MAKVFLRVQYGVCVQIISVFSCDVYVFNTSALTQVCVNENASQYVRTKSGAIVGRRLHSGRPNLCEHSAATTTPWLQRCVLCL